MLDNNHLYKSRDTNNFLSRHDILVREILTVQTQINLPKVFPKPPTSRERHI